MNCVSNFYPFLIFCHVPNNEPHTGGRDQSRNQEGQENNFQERGGQQQQQSGAGNKVQFFFFNFVKFLFVVFTCNMVFFCFPQFDTNTNYDISTMLARPCYFPVFIDFPSARTYLQNLLHSFAPVTKKHCIQQHVSEKRNIHITLPH